MRFWDASAVVPLITTQPASEVISKLLQEDTDVTVWWVTWIECAVAISRLWREEAINDAAEEEARVALYRLADAWTEVQPTVELRSTAAVVSIDHPLKAADCLRLAAALRWYEGDTSGAGFICLDERLRRAATGEGFDVLPEEEDAQQ